MRGFAVLGGGKSTTSEGALLLWSSCLHSSWEMYMRPAMGSERSSPLLLEFHSLGKRLFPPDPSI